LIANRNVKTLSFLNIEIAKPGLSTLAKLSISGARNLKFSQVRNVGKGWYFEVTDAARLCHFVSSKTPETLAFLNRRNLRFYQVFASAFFGVNLRFS
jgi:hypothetical protein